ncbi:MAG: PspC domain-containing protein [Pseudomonadales bacterium]
MANSTLERIRGRIRLDSRNGWIAGVCAGVANFLETDPAFVRVAVAVSALFFPKLTIAAYLIAWLILDEERKL